MTVLTYGMENLSSALEDAFVGPDAASYSLSSAPMTGPIADLVTVFYGEKAGTVTLNLVKIAKLPDGVSPDDACAQAMAALRTFAGLDPATAKPATGLDSSMLAFAFTPEGSPIDAAITGPQIDGIFRLRYDVPTPEASFTCTADLLDPNFTVVKN